MFPSQSVSQSTYGLGFICIKYNTCPSVIIRVQKKYSSEIYNFSISLFDKSVMFMMVSISIPAASIFLAI